MPCTVVVLVGPPIGCLCVGRRSYGVIAIAACMVFHLHTRKTRLASPFTQRDYASHPRVERRLGKNKPLPVYPYRQFI